MQFTSIKEVIIEIALELKECAKAKRSLWELKAAEKGSPIIANTIYTTILVILGIVIGTITLIASLFAISLLFVTSGTEASAILVALTFSATILLLFFLLVFAILLPLRKRVAKHMELQMLNSYLDKTEASKSREAIEEQNTSNEQKEIIGA